MIRIEKSLWSFGLRAASVEITGLSNGPASVALRDEVERRSAAFLNMFRGLDIGSLPAIAAYKDFYARQKIARSVVRPSVERMAASLLKGKPMPSVSSVVDAYNILSVERQMCMGAHSIELIDLPVLLKPVQGEEMFTPLGGSPERVRKGEYAYFSSSGVIICRDNAVQCASTKVDMDTRDVFLIVEGLSIQSEDDILQSAADTAALIQRYAGGQVSNLALAVPYSLY